MFAQCMVQLVEKGELKIGIDWLQLCSEHAENSDMNPSCQLAYNKRNWSLLLHMLSRYNCTCLRLNR